VSENLEPMDDLNANDGRPGMGLGEGFAAPRARRRFPTQVLVLLLIVGTSAGALYGMRRYGMKSGVQFDKVDVEFKDTDTEKAKTYERIMADLATVQKPLDVALGDFGRSPFMHDNSARITPANIDNFLPAQTEEERHRQEAVTALKAMHLNGIIGNIARIDETTVKAGDTVADIFTVKAVDGRTVVFEAYGEEYTLTMEVKKVTGGKGPSKMRALDHKP
jgi:hypothetical protein